ncbi:DUF6230 family protein [Streptomyces sp. NPDC001493]
MSSQIRGGTRWKRFALVMVPSVVATAAVGVGLAQGALAASFSISGQDFKVTADQLVGHDFVQYGNVAAGDAGKHPVAVSGFHDATITNMCQSVVTDIPGLGKWTLMLTAGTDPKKPVEATGLYLDVSQLDADAYFEKIDIGVAAGHLGEGTKTGTGIQPNTTGASPYGFAQRAETATLDNVEQRAWATTAGTFKLTNLSLRLNPNDHECQLSNKDK